MLTNKGKELHIRIMVSKAAKMSLDAEVLFFQNAQRDIKLLFNDSDSETIKECLKSAKNTLKSSDYYYWLFYVNEILKIRNPDSKKAENYITNEIAELHHSVNYSSKLWKNKK